MQAFLQYGHLRKAVGVELAESRFNLAKKAVYRLAKLYPDRFRIAKNSSTLVQLKDLSNRVLEFRKQNLFECSEAAYADIVICQTHVHQLCLETLSSFLQSFKRNSRVLCFENLFKVSDTNRSFFDQIPVNESEEDRFETTWSRSSGHHFFLFRRKNP